MDEDIAKVEHDPAAGGAPLDALRANSGFCHPLRDGSVDRPELALIRTGRDDKVIGEWRELVDIQDDGISSRRVAYDVREQKRPFSSSFWGGMTHGRFDVLCLK